MNTASILFKTDPKVKTKASKTARTLGLTLSAVLNGYLREFIKTKRISFGAENMGEEPSPYLIKTLKKSEEDIKAGRVSPRFKNVKDSIAWLNDPNAKYQNGDRV